MNAFHFLTLVKNWPVLFGHNMNLHFGRGDHNLKSTTCSAQQLWRDRSVTRSPIDSVNNEIAEKPAQHIKDNKIKERNAIFYIEWVARNGKTLWMNKRLTYIAIEYHIQQILYMAYCWNYLHWTLWCLTGLIKLLELCNSQLVLTIWTSLSLDQSKTLESDTIMQQNVCCARRVWPVYGKVPVSRSLQLS